MLLLHYFDINLYTLCTIVVKLELFVVDLDANWIELKVKMREKTSRKTSHFARSRYYFELNSASDIEFEFLVVRRILHVEVRVDKQQQCNNVY